MLLAVPWAPLRWSSGYGPTGRTAAASHATAVSHASSAGSAPPAPATVPAALRLRNRRRAVRSPPRDGSGRGRIWRLRRNRTGGVRTTSHAPGRTTTARQASSHRSRTIPPGCGATRRWTWCSSPWKWATASRVLRAVAMASPLTPRPTASKYRAVSHRRKAVLRTGYTSRRPSAGTWANASWSGVWNNTTPAARTSSTSRSEAAGRRARSSPSAAGWASGPAGSDGGIGPAPLGPPVPPEGTWFGPLPAADGSPGTPPCRLRADPAGGCRREGLRASAGVVTD